MNYLSIGPALLTGQISKQTNILLSRHKKWAVWPQKSGTGDLEVKPLLNKQTSYGSQSAVNLE